MTTDSRYVIETRNGQRHRVRDVSALASEVLTLLGEHGPSPKRRLTDALNTTLWAVGAALETLTREGRVERFRAKSLRGRLDQFWCLAGDAPIARPTSYNGSATLLAMQATARARLNVIDGFTQ